MTHQVALQRVRDSSIEKRKREGGYHMTGSHSFTIKYETLADHEQSLCSEATVFIKPTQAARPSITGF